MKLSEIKRILLKKGFRISRVQRHSSNKDLRGVYGTLLTGILLIGFFSILPTTINYVGKNILSSDPIDNNSKKHFDKVFAGKEINTKAKIDRKINDKNLFDDIIELNESPTSSVRLSAATLNELFKDTNYNLKEIRKNKIVKPVEIGLLPTEIKKIESVKKRKELFIKIVLPLVLNENNRILLDRKRLFVILNKTIIQSLKKNG